MVRVYSNYSLDSVQRFLEEVTTPSVSITPTLVIPPRTEPTEGSAAGEGTLLKKNEMFMYCWETSLNLSRIAGPYKIAVA